MWRKGRRASCWPTHSWLMAPAATSRPSVTPEALYRSALDCASAELLCRARGGKSCGASCGASGGAPCGALHATTRRRKCRKAGGACGAIANLVGRVCLTHSAKEVRSLTPGGRDTPSRAESDDASTRIAARRDGRLRVCARDVPRAFFFSNERRSRNGKRVLTAWRTSHGCSLLARGGVGGLDISSPLHAQQAQPLEDTQLHGTRHSVTVAALQLGQRGPRVRQRK